MARKKKELTEKEKNEKKKKKKEWDDLFEYVRKLYGQTPTTQMICQMQNYTKAPYNFTYIGMRLALEYFHETLGNPVAKDKGVGIIPYQYDNAKKHFIECRKLKKINSHISQNWEEKPIVIEVKDAGINSSNVRKKAPSYDDIDKEIEDDNYEE